MARGEKKTRGELRENDREFILLMVCMEPLEKGTEEKGCAMNERSRKEIERGGE